MINAKYGAVIG